MIKGYDIRFVNNEEILYVHLDFNSEFASLNSKKSNKKLKNQIKEYLNKNNIDFNGAVVAIMVGGVMMGTLLLNSTNDIEKSSVLNSSSSKIVSIIDVANNELVGSNVGVTNQVDESKEDKVQVEEEQKENIEVVKTQKEPVTSETDKSNINTQEESFQNNEIKVQEDEIEETGKSNLTYVTINRTNGTVINIELEEYLVGVVAAEMPAQFNSEALKAQAVVARTYTLRAIATGKRLTDNSSTQNYKSNNELKILWGSSYNMYYNKIKNAVDSTKGMYLTYNGEYIDAVYHSTSNGKTEDSVNVWGNNIPYLKSVNSPFDNTNKSFSTTVFLSYDNVSSKLNNIVNIDTDFNILSRNQSDRVSELEINGTTYSGVVFRNLLGLRSADFVIEKTDAGINITTKGYGHGVGMSQYGANGMANNGYDFKSILLHYYSGVKLNYS